MAQIKAKRNYKSNIFVMIFREKETLLELYNAINGTDYQNPDDLEINTLENAVYISMKNDLSFVLDWRLNLYEHQSTYNPNMPLRDLFYVAKVYSGIIDERKLLPKFIVFYNGTNVQPERQELKLSDSYTVENEEIALELKVLVLNVNLGQNKELMNACKTLNDYAVYVDRVRRYQETMALEEAVDRAIKECIDEGILKEFLSRNFKEAKEASILEYTFEEAIVVAREEGHEYGWIAGVEEGKKAGLEEG